MSYLKMAAADAAGDAPALGSNPRESCAPLPPLQTRNPRHPQLDQVEAQMLDRPKRMPLGMVSKEISLRAEMDPSTM
jgi:hypothetical protein